MADLVVVGGKGFLGQHVMHLAREQGHRRLYYALPRVAIIGV